MKTENADLIFDISPVELNSIAAWVLETDAVSATILSANKIGRSGGGATVGIYRVVGTAETTDGEQAWSAVAKVLGPPELARAGIEMNAHRELVVYRTGVFAELCGGVRSARCYGIQEKNSLQILWLEDLSDAPQAPWLPQHYIDTARHLGQFNGHWPEDVLPAWEWLGQATFRQTFRNQQYRTDFARLSDCQSESLIHQAFSPDEIKRLLEFWEQSDSLFTKADATPKGVCHADCHPKNLFPMGASTGQTFTIGIDWELVGIGCFGLDIGHLLASPIRWLELPLDQAAVLVDGIFEAYIAGLRETGWAGNEDRVRLAYLTRLECETLRMVALTFRMADSPKISAAVQKFVSHSGTEVSGQRAEHLQFFWNFSGEARQLARKL